MSVPTKDLNSTMPEISLIGDFSILIYLRNFEICADCELDVQQYGETRHNDFHDWHNYQSWEVRVFIEEGDFSRYERLFHTERFATEENARYHLATVAKIAKALQKI